VTSRFLKKVAQPISRFLAGLSRRSLGEGGRRTINRIVRKLPIVTKFMSFFVPDELRLDPPTVEVALQEEAPQHIAPVYNLRARRPKSPTLG